MRKTKLLLTFFAFQAIFFNMAFGQIYDHAYIENFAKQQLELSLTPSEDKQLSIHITSIDPRVNIKPCFSELSANIPEFHNGRNVNIEINCSDSTPWRLYIPSKISIMAPIIVALSPIDKGSVLTSDNIGLKYVDEKRIRGERMTDSKILIGAKSKRSLSMGTAITRKNICLVCKGDIVTIEAKSTSLSIKTDGISMSNGHIGDKVKVKNERSGKIVYAKVSGLNKVEINF